jgi:hypothetical protein
MSSSSSLQFGIASPKRVVSEKVRARQAFTENVRRVMKLAGLSTKLALAIYGSKEVSTVTYTHNGVEHKKELTKTEFGRWKKSLKEAIKQLGKDGIALTRRSKDRTRESGFSQMRTQDPELVRFFSAGAPGSNLGPVFAPNPGPTLDEKTRRLKFNKDTVYTATGQQLANVLAFTQRGGPLENFVQTGTITSLFHIYATNSNSKLPFSNGMFFRDDARQALRGLIVRAIQKDLDLLRDAGALTDRAQMRGQQLIASVGLPAAPPSTALEAQQMLADSTFEKPATSGSKTKKVTLFNPNFFVGAHLSKLSSVYKADKVADKQRLDAVKLNRPLIEQVAAQDYAIKVSSVRNGQARTRAAAPAKKLAAAEKRRAAKLAKGK